MDIHMAEVGLQPGDLSDYQPDGLEVVALDADVGVLQVDGEVLDSTSVDSLFGVLRKG